MNPVTNLHRWSLFSGGRMYIPDVEHISLTHKKKVIGIHLLSKQMTPILLKFVIGNRFSKKKEKRIRKVFENKFSYV